MHLLGLQSLLGTRGLFKPEPLKKPRLFIFARILHPLTNKSLWQKGSGLHMSNMCFREFWPAMRACSEHVIRVQRCCVSKKVREAICSRCAKTINIAMVIFFANMINNKLILVLAMTCQSYFGSSITVFNSFYLMTSRPFPRKQWQNYVAFSAQKLQLKRLIFVSNDGFRQSK